MIFRCTTLKQAATRFAKVGSPGHSELHRIQRAETEAVGEVGKQGKETGQIEFDLLVKMSLTFWSNEFDQFCPKSSSRLLPRCSLLPRATSATSAATRYRTLQLLPHATAATARYSCYRTLQLLPHATAATARYSVLKPIRARGSTFFVAPLCSKPRGARRCEKTSSEIKFFLAKTQCSAAAFRVLQAVAVCFS